MCCFSATPIGHAASSSAGSLNRVQLASAMHEGLFGPMLLGSMHSGEWDFFAAAFVPMKMIATPNKIKQKTTHVDSNLTTNVGLNMITNLASYERNFSLFFYIALDNQVQKTI